jgi:hypothetical protein
VSISTQAVFPPTVEKRYSGSRERKSSRESWLSMSDAPMRSTAEDILLRSLEGLRGLGTEPLTPQNRIFIEPLRVSGGVSVEHDEGLGPAPPETFFYVIAGAKFAPVYARAVTRRILPSLSRIEDRGPERESRALNRPLPVDRAAFVLPENAVIARLFLEADGKAAGIYFH